MVARLAVLTFLAIRLCSPVIVYAQGIPNTNATAMTTTPASGSFASGAMCIGTACYYSSSGDPTGVTSAEPGSWYTDTSGTGGLWFKQSASDATGWVDTTAAGGIANIVEDLTPQLGGELLTNGNNITGTDTIEANKFRTNDPTADACFERSPYKSNLSGITDCGSNGASLSVYALYIGDATGSYLADGGASGSVDVMDAAFADNATLDADRYEGESIALTGTGVFGGVHTSFGEMYISSASATTVSTSWADVAGTWASGNLTNMVHTGGNLTASTNHGDDHEISCAWSFSGTASKIFQIGISINGADPGADCTTEVEINATSDIESGSVGCMADLTNTTRTIELQVKSADGGTSATFGYANCKSKRN